MKRCIATVSLSGTLEDKLRAIAAAGFDGVEIFENDLVNSGASPREIRDLAATLGLSIDLFQPFRDLEGVPDEVFRKNLDRIQRKFDVMAELGRTDAAGVFERRLAGAARCGARGCAVVSGRGARRRTWNPHRL